MVGGSIADQRGRRGAILIDIWIFLIGGTLMSCARNMQMITIARLIMGFAAGLCTVVVPVYLGEVAPPTLRLVLSFGPFNPLILYYLYRGTLGTCTQFALVIGILMSTVLAFPFATVDRWPYLFGITPLVCVVQLLISPYLLESPKWLLSRDKDSNEARSVVKQLRGYRNDEDVEAEVQNFTYGTFFWIYCFMHEVFLSLFV